MKRFSAATEFRQHGRCRRAGLSLATLARCKLVDLPEPRDPIRIERRVGAYHRNGHDQGLGDYESIERVFMMVRQQRLCVRLGDCDRQYDYAGVTDSSNDPFPKTHGKFELLKSNFDRDLPDRTTAQKEIILGIRHRIASDPG